MFRAPQFGRGTTDGAARVDKFVGREVFAAFLALVTVCLRVVTMGTFTRNVSVGKEGLSLRIVILLAFLFDELAFIVERAEELRGRATMRLSL